MPLENQIVDKKVQNTPRNIYIRDAFRVVKDDWLSRGIFVLCNFVAWQLSDTVLRYSDSNVANSEGVERRINKSWVENDPRVRIVYMPVEIKNYGQQHGIGTSLNELYYPEPEPSPPVVKRFVMQIVFAALVNLGWLNTIGARE